MLRSSKLCLALSLVVSGAFAVAACVGDDPATPGGNDTDAASGDSATTGDGAPPGDGSSPTDSGVDSGPPLKPSDPVAISAGLHHACALRLDHQVYCWGDNSTGELGPGSVAAASATPVAIPFAAGVNPVSIFAGNNLTCIVDDTGRVWCWGSNSGYGLGNNNGDAGNFTTPAQAVTGSGNLLASSGSAGRYTTDPGACVIAADKTVQCWGTSLFEGYGVASPSTFATPAPVSTGNTPVLSVSCNGIFCGAVVTHGGAATIATWGQNTDGELGVLDASNFSDYPAYPILPLGNPAAMVSVGTFHGCAVDSVGAISCWGLNAKHELGASASGSIVDPPVGDVDFQSDKVTAIATGDESTCVIIATGDVWCFGDNSLGQLGTSGGGTNATRQQIATISHDAVAITGSLDFYCVIRQGLVSGGRSVWCWGSNYEEELGVADAGSPCGGEACSPTPVQVALPAD